MDVKKILVVDDDQDILESYVMILESKGYSVYQAGNSIEAINIYNQNKPDIIFLDLIMEKVDSGIEVCKRIREKDKNTKIYLLSDVGESSAENISINEIGFNGVMQKPLKPEELLNLASK